MIKRIPWIKSILIVLLSTFLSGCSEIPDYSSVDDNSVTEDRTISTGIEILWIIDNSGSMQTKQTLVANAFNSFSGLLLQKGYHFRMAVITTDAYLKNNKEIYRNNCGLAILDENTTNLNTCFSTNIQQGIAGSGTERAFDSFITAIESPLNAGYNFPGPGSFFRVIIIGDEDDSSVISGTTIQPVEYYTEYLSSRYDAKAYSISTPPGVGLPGVGIRIRQLIDELQGINCDISAADFSGYMLSLVTAITRDATSIILSRNPVPGSLSVTADSIPVPEDFADGWTFEPGTRTVYFNGSSLPAENVLVRITYTPE